MANDENYFSWDNFDEIAELDLHMSYLAELQKKYDVSKEAKEEFAKQYANVKKCQDRKKINICVIGEASTGKSAFVNALLRMEILSSSALQGTTRICTYIEYSDEFTITLDAKSGETKQEKYESLDELYDVVYTYTCCQEDVDKINKITIGIPAAFLDEGVEIIDTPGINGDLKWYNTNEWEQIRDSSDAIFVLTDANKAMPQSLVDFINMKLSENLDKCVFIATKCDVINGNDKEEHGVDFVIDYIQRKIKSEFNNGNELVFPYAAIEIIDNFCGESGTSQEMIELSENSEIIFRKHLIKQEFFNRKISQLKSVASMYEGFFDILNQETEEHEKKLESLKDKNDVNLETLLLEYCKKEIEPISQRMNDRLTEVVDDLYSDGLMKIREIFAQIDEMILSGQSLASKQVADICVNELLNLTSGVYQYYQFCREEYDKYIELIKDKLTFEFEEKCPSKDYNPDLKSHYVVQHPIYQANNWNQKRTEFIEEITKIKKPQNQLDQINSILCTRLDEIVEMANFEMNICLANYTDDENGIFNWEAGNYCVTNEKMYQIISKQWYEKEVKSEIEKSSKLIEEIAEDLTKIKNRKFSAKSCVEQLESRKKGSKKG